MLKNSFIRIDARFCGKWWSGWPRYEWIFTYVFVAQFNIVLQRWPDTSGSGLEANNHLRPMQEASTFG